jgi:hypothetical protein
MSNRGFRVLAVLVLLAAAIFAIRQFAPAADGFAAFRPVSASELAAHPEGHLYFPGSVVLQQSTYDMTGPLLSAGQPAGIAATAATSASKKEVISWYEAQMQSRGWSPECGEVCVPTSSEWSRGNRELFTVHFLESTAVQYRRTDLPTEYAIGYWVAARLGIDELYCLVFRPPHYAGAPTGQRYLC